ncbi:hypothetical protein MUK42_17009 [Musa troglodytarum]|uniref:Uncharacterized protein n=1 Tax=Musa troglodytarum TaxID=320322 RepID=A0A9E7HNP2_9LILI|nr:hypothetical protein MUK42_17009 [Musa troglodytarum]
MASSQPLTFPVAPAVSLAAQDLTHGLLVIELQKKRIGYGRGCIPSCMIMADIRFDGGGGGGMWMGMGWSACCAAHEASTATGEVWLGQQGGATEQARNLVSKKVCAHAEERSPMTGAAVPTTVLTRIYF